jgi:hypothetical protein
MATTFKTFLDDDLVSTRTLLHENIPITGTIVSGSSYGTNNIKTYSHGMFVSMYDYPYLSSSANHLFDMTVGLTSDSEGSSSSDLFVKKKTNIYNQMGQVLAGHDTTGSILRFDRDGDPATGGDKYDSMFFLNFSRLLVKDEIKKGSFELKLGISEDSENPFASIMTIKDENGSTNYKINSPSGEYGILYASGGGTDLSADQTNKSVGFVFYQAGIVALSTAIFAQSGTSSPSDNMLSNQYGQLDGYVPEMSGTSTVYSDVKQLFRNDTIAGACGALRNRIQNITFNNTTELNSTIHFCRVNHNDFNYSSNPTYLTGSQIRVKDSDVTAAPVSYITTVGLYSPDNELLAVAKLSEPLKKDPTQELILRVRLDY